MSFEEQIMSKDKYLSIFLKPKEAIAVIILQIFFATCSNEVEYLNISFKDSLPSKTCRAYVVF